MNYEEVLRLGKGKPGRDQVAAGGLLQRADRRTARSGSRCPGNPTRSLKTQAQRDSALEAERAKPGRIIEESPEGLRRVILLSDLTTRHVAAPDHDAGPAAVHHRPRLARDPGQRPRRHRARRGRAGSGCAATARSSASRAARCPTPGSPAAARSPGRRDTILFDFQVISPHVNLEDLRWVSPDFPVDDGQRRARGALASAATGPSTTSASSTCGTGRQRRRRRPGRDRGQAARPRLPRHAGLAARSRPRRGPRVRGHACRSSARSPARWPARASSTSMDVRLDWAFADARVPGHPVTTIVGDGGVGATRRQRAHLHRFDGASSSDIDLRTVAPGRPRGDPRGTPRGDRHARRARCDNVIFQGIARHRDGDRPVSDDDRARSSRYPLRYASAW